MNFSTMSSPCANNIEQNERNTVRVLSTMLLLDSKAGGGFRRWVKVLRGFERISHICIGAIATGRVDATRCATDLKGH